MTLQAISRDLQFECFDVKLVFEKFFSYHKFFVYDYVFDASLLFIIYSIHLALTVQNFMGLASVVKKFKFWRARLGKTPISVRLNLFLITTHSKNVIHRVLAV